ncbi:MAG: murein biosynthesis integral membrane protein MurJ [Desulfobacteraceae bacterium]|nr:murein biosynthesis integral membrane protein MurJ [Desulfobacteraceae bacterium]
MAFWKTRHQMGLAALIMGASILLSRFMGLIRDKLISLLFGATQESDLYFAAFVIPDFINYLLAGGYFSITLIPFLAQHFEKDPEEGWKFFSTVFFWITAAISVLTLSAMIFAPRLAFLAAPGITPEASERLAFFLRIILPAQVFFLCGSCMSALLYLRKQFFVPALSSVVYNLWIIGGGVLMRHRGMEGFCWGVLVGSFVGNFLLPFLAARTGDGLKMRLCLYHPGLKRYFLMALPLMIGKSITIVDEQFIRIFGSLAGVGAISWLSYARRIMLVPVSVVAQAIGVASYPFLSELYAKREFPRFFSTVRAALQNVITLLIPLSLWMMLVAEPTVRLIFQQGRFGAADTANTTRLLQQLLICVTCWGYQQVLGRAFYARMDTLSPAILGSAVTVLVIPVFYVLTKTMGPMGVALASASSIVAYSLFLTIWWRVKEGREAFKGLLSSTAKVLAVSLASAVPAWVSGKANAFDAQGSPYLAALFELTLSGILFGGSFALLSSFFIPELARPFLERTGPVGRFLLRKKTA